MQDFLSGLIGAGEQGAAGGGMGMIVMMVAMFGIMYFVLIRPQQKRMKEHATMLGGLKKGDSVVTRGGIVGKISGIQDNIVVLELQEKVRVRVLKSYIEARHLEGTAAQTSAPDKGVAVKDGKAQAAAE